MKVGDTEQVVQEPVDSRIRHTRDHIFAFQHSFVFERQSYGNVHPKVTAGDQPNDSVRGASL